MERLAALVLIATILASCSPEAPASGYLPEAGVWERRSPDEVGMDSTLLAQAVASVSEWPQPRDFLEAQSGLFHQEPMSEVVGPFLTRGPATGLVVRHGFIVAEWGEPQKVDPAYSVTKSFLSSTIGLAYDRGLIHDVHDPVRNDFAPVVALKGPPGAAGPPPAPSMVEPTTSRRPQEGVRAAFDAFEVLLPFESELNSRITWDHLLRQTSDWEGTLWGKPDWVDRPPEDLEAHRTRTHHEPGTVYTYNDVRVNLLALAGLNVWRRPLPEVLRDDLMDPIGASHTWRWLGYDNSWVLMDGTLVQSVSGGAHWGGGMWINAFDLARFGLLTLHHGRWGDRQILSDEWVDMALTPTPARNDVGYMNWFLNREGGFRHSGAGNTIYVYPDEDLVVVTRWTARAFGVVSAIRASIVQ